MMSGVFAILLLLSIIFLVSGLVAPQAFAKHSKNSTFTRKTAGVGFGFFVLVFFILTAITAPHTSQPIKGVFTATTISSTAKTLGDSVTTKRVVETKPVAFTTTAQNDAGLPKGQTKIIQAGQNGVETLTYEVTYSSDQQINKALLSDTITIQPTTEIIANGTFVAPPTQSISDHTPTPAPQPPAAPRLTITFTCASAVDYVSGSVCVHTQPNAALTITVGYCSGYDATSQSLQGMKYADSNGNYTWTWKPETKCPGNASAVVTAGWEGQSASNADNFTVH